MMQPPCINVMFNFMFGPAKIKESKFNEHKRKHIPIPLS